MEKLIKHKFLNSVLFTALFVPLGFFLLRDTIAAITGIMFESIGGKESLLYQINDDITRLIIVGLLMLIMPIFFRGKCNFGFRGGKLKLGVLLALPELIVPLWNFLQLKIYDAPSDIQYQISENGKELTISLPHTAGASYNVKSSDPESFVLKERQENGDTYLFVFDHNGASTEKVKITFGLRLGDMSTSIKNYSVSVSFKDDGSISTVGG